MNNNIVNILNLIFSNDEAKDFIINNLAQSVETFVKSNISLFDSVTGLNEKALDDEDIRKSFEIDIEKLSPGNPINTWDNESKTYKNVQLNFLYTVYKESAYRHANKTVTTRITDYNDLLNKLKKQFDQTGNPYNRIQNQMFDDTVFNLTQTKSLKNFLTISNNFLTTSKRKDENVKR